MAPPPTLQELIEIVRRDAGSDLPIDQLVVAATAAAQLEETTDALLGHFVDRCRRDGRSWTEISAALGVTKQAVHKRFASAMATQLAAASPRPTFERFTDRARHVLAESRRAAIGLGDGFVGTEHLLLALFSEPAGLAARALAAMDVTEDSVRAAVAAAGPAPPKPPAMPTALPTPAVRPAALPRARARPTAPGLTPAAATLTAPRPARRPGPRSPARPGASFAMPWPWRWSSATTTSALSTCCSACTGTRRAWPREFSRPRARLNRPRALTSRTCCAASGRAHSAAATVLPECLTSFMTVGEPTATATTAPAATAFATPDAWYAWLTEHHGAADGLWLKLAKRGAPEPTLSYAEALDVALCFGWIDAQTRSLDGSYWLKRFTPRKPASRWSRINTKKAEALIAAGRMQPAGLVEVERARADGRWDAAYAGPRTITVPADLTAALAENPEAAAFFATLSSLNRYAILYRLATVKRAETRERKITQFVQMLAEHRTLHP